MIRSDEGKKGSGLQHDSMFLAFTGGAAHHEKLPGKYSL
jgi:hypothetical protein